MWAGIKQAERGYACQGAQKPVKVELWLAAGPETAEVESSLSEIGAEILARPKSGKLLIRLDPLHLPQLCLEPGIRNIILAGDRKKRPVKALAAVLLAALFLATGLLWFYCSVEKGVQAKVKEAPPLRTVQPDREVGSSHPGENLELFNKGLAAYERGDKNQAAFFWEKVVQSQPMRLGLRKSLGRLWLELGRPQKAAWHFRAILKADPKNKEAQNALEMLEEQK
ncbi:hypothetical protein X474_25460 [Dethiosulfatarculus sandiegensis]|uniref:Uncharacterized protein n=1 Tax=Dethiosulfatarculus sandiegensis TaxID=1429043 RepID=A0A0D2IYV7_9BACT|nr:hypothetical protein X474_25460 [Dethiosulfatarculus sandiegensis]